MADPISGIAAAATIGGALISSSSAEDAADSQTEASRAANATQRDMFAQTQKNIKPYLDVGEKASGALTKAAGLDTDNPLTSALLKPIVMDQAALEKTPGYQFQKNQGLKAVQSSAAARGLGSSGAALKGAATFATGLADSNYQTQYANEVANQTNAFNKLYSLVGTGQSSAVGQGQIASGVADNIAGNTIGAGNAQAASTIAGGNAINSGINNAISSNYLNRATNTGGTNSFGPFNSEAYANGLPWSDRRVKENIKYKRIENGIPMFEFNYVWDKAKRYIGVIAQQVKELVPDAVIESDGVYQVDYDKLGIKFREVNYGF